MTRPRLAIATSHPVQYYGPLFRELAKSVELTVFYAHKATPEQQAAAGFGTAFEWDVDLTSGYDHVFLKNTSAAPGTDHFGGCDTPEIGAHLARGRFDAVMVFGWHLKSSLQAAVAARGLGLPVLVRGDSHLQTPRSQLKKFAKSLVYPPFLRLFSAALYVGRRSEAYYRHYRFPPGRLFFSPHCVDVDWFRERANSEARAKLRGELGIGDAEKVVLFAGKLIPFKRPGDVVTACALARSAGQQVRLVVAGSGKLEGELRMLASELGVPATFLGFQNQTQMPAIYAAADVLMLPSDGRETWGLVCNEALACGTPVLVSSAVGCSDDLAADGSVGQVYPMGNVAAAAEKLLAIVCSPPNPADLARVSDRYSLRAAAAGVMAAINAVSVR